MSLDSIYKSMYVDKQEVGERVWICVARLDCSKYVSTNVYNVVWMAL